MRVFVLTAASVITDDFLEDNILDVVQLVHKVLQPNLTLVASESASGTVEGYVTEVVATHLRRPSVQRPFSFTAK